MIVLVHLLFVTMASMFGYDVTRHLLPVKLPGVVARVVIAGLAIVLWTTCPVSILAGLAVGGLASILAPLMAVEGHSGWGRTLKDMITLSKYKRAQTQTRRKVESKLNDMGTRFEVTEKIGHRIPRL